MESTNKYKCTNCYQTARYSKKFSNDTALGRLRMFMGKEFDTHKCINCNCVVFIKKRIDDGQSFTKEELGFFPKYIAFDDKDKWYTVTLDNIQKAIIQKQGGKTNVSSNF